MIYLPSPLEDGAFLAELKGERGVPSASPTYPVDILPRLDHPVSNHRMITSVPRRSLPAGLAIAFACHELMRRRSWPIHGPAGTVLVICLIIQSESLLSSWLRCSLLTTKGLAQHTPRTIVNRNCNLSVTTTGIPSKPVAHRI